MSLTRSSEEGRGSSRCRLGREGERESKDTRDDWEKRGYPRVYKLIQSALREKKLTGTSVFGRFGGVSHHKIRVKKKRALGNSDCGESPTTELMRGIGT